MKAFSVLFISYTAILGLTILEIIYLEKSIITTTLYIFVLIVCVINIFTSSTGANSRRKKSYKYRNTISGIAGLITSFYIQNGYIGKAKVTNMKLLGDNLALNFGILSGMLLLLLITLFLGTLFINAVGLKKKEWTLLSTGVCIGITMFLFFI